MHKVFSAIDVGNEASWLSAPFLTLDIDWAHDAILTDTIELIERYEVPATWFVTHDTPMLDRLRANPDFELGIHPNFNWLLSGDSRAGRDAAEVVDRLLAIVPEAKCVRSHSTTQSSVLLDLFVQRGLTHESNSFIPAQSGIPLKPWKLWSGLTRIPYFWEDDVCVLYNPSGVEPITSMTSSAGIKVFDFHPIHVFLNTENLERYESTRELHKCPDVLSSHRYVGVGTRTRFIEFLTLAQASLSASSESSKRSPGLQPSTSIGMGFESK